MENVTDRVSNPFGMEPPHDINPEAVVNVGRNAVYGYGDANADFHVIGDHPRVHGGTRTGVPFTETEGAHKLQRALHELGFVEDEYSNSPSVDNLFMDYIHMSNSRPTEESYAEHERFFDAELRAINAHILIPVGEKAVRHVLEEYTTLAHKLADKSLDELHARQIRGRGFLVVPSLDPEDWDSEDEREFIDSLREILNSDYRQTKGVATMIG